MERSSSSCSTGIRTKKDGSRTEHVVGSRKLDGGVPSGRSEGSRQRGDEDLRDQVGPLEALDAFSVDIRRGELICILGPSGCGKTTLLWAMAGLHELTRGEVLLDGEPIAGPRPAEIGMIFQDANLLPWRNLRQNINFPFEIKRQG